MENAGRPDPSSADVPHLLHSVAKGDRKAETELVPLVYDELHQIAHKLMRREGPHILQTTALVLEAYLRLMGPRPIEWQGRTHFFRVAARVMRRILVDHARSRRADKRGGGVIDEAFDESLAPAIDADDTDRILVVDEALTRLAAVDQRQAQIVELRFFVGMSVEDTAEALALSPRTITREWQLARAWLSRELAP